MALTPTSSKRDAIRGTMSDDELVRRARAGEGVAFDELYRRHAGAARRTARAILGSRQEADDVVSDAFVGVLRAIDAGLGPRDNFRAYLLACVRNGCKMTWRSNRPVPRDPSAFDDGSLVFEDPERYVEADIVAAAFSSLSPCWQQTLWLTAVEGKDTEEVARQLRRSPSAVPSLALRAREAFAEAYLAQHMSRATAESCKRVAPKLAGYVRNHIGDVDRMRIEAHLAECADCTTAAAGLRDVNSCLRSLTLPVGLAALGASGMGSAGGAAAVTAGLVSSSAASGAGASGAGLGALMAKFAAIAALASPALAYEMTHPTAMARAETAASAGAGDDAGIDGLARVSADVVDATAAAGLAEVGIAGSRTSGEPAPRTEGDGDASTGEPPAPPSSPSSPPPSLLDVLLAGLLPDPAGAPQPSTPPPDMVPTTMPDGTTILGTAAPAPLAPPVTAGAVVVGSDSGTAAAGAMTDAAGVAVGAGSGSENVTAGAVVALPPAVADVGARASIDAEGIARGIIP